MYEKLKESIEYYGYLDPIIWNKRTGMIVSGHQRFQVMKDIAERDGEELDEIDVMEVDMSEAQQDSFMVAINKITGLWDDVKLKSLFQELSQEDLKYTGYEDFEIERMLSENIDLGEYEDDDEIIETPKNDSFRITIYFDTEGERDSAYLDLKEKGFNVKM